MREPRYSLECRAGVQFFTSRGSVLAFINDVLHDSTIRVRFNSETGEYRVAPSGRGNEDCAYYTTDLQDAFNTAKNMKFIDTVSTVRFCDMSGRERTDWLNAAKTRS